MNHVPESNAASDTSACHALVLNSMTEGVNVSNEAGIIVYTNPAEDAMFGYGEGELAGKHVKVLNAYEAEENERIVQKVISQLRSKGVWEGEWHNRRKDGSIFYTQSRITALNQHGKTLWICVQRDITQQKLERKALSNAETYLSLLLKSIDDHLVSYDRQWRYTYVNDSAARLLGKSREELLGHSIWELFPEAVGNQYYRELHEALEQQLPKVSQHYYAPWDAWFENHIYPTQNGVTVFAADITNRKRTEIAYAESEQRLQFALEAGNMGAWQWHIQKNEFHWLQGMAVLHGLPSDISIVSIKDYERYVHPDDRAYLAGMVHEALVARRGHNAEYRVVWPDGSIHWIGYHAKLFLDESGQPLQMAGLCIDITQRKGIEQDLKFLADASAELASFVDRQSTLDKVAQLAVPTFADWCTVDLLEDDGTLRRVAVAHVDPKKIALAHEIRRRFPPDPEAPGGTWHVLRTGRASLISEITDEMIEKRVPDPGYLAAIQALGLRSYIGAPLTSHGKTVGIVTFISAESKRLYNADDLALAEDLAKRAAIAIENAELYQALKQSDRGKDVFLATLAHELRNPLAPITNALSIMKLAAHNPKMVEDSVKLMERQVRHLIRLVDDLMDISRITTGKIELKMARTSLADILNSAVETSMPHIEAAQQKLTVALPDQPMDILADKVRLAQVFSNLLNNAAKYTNANGRIEVTAKPALSEFVVRVRDTGIGISSGMLKGIFTMFTQVEHPLARSQGGLGIGLALVDGLVRMHGGRVEAYSDGLGKGSEFVVYLPRNIDGLVAAPDEDTASGSSDQPATVRHILVVDDNVDAASTTAELLKMLGNKVDIVHDGVAAVEAVIALQPEIVLLDIGLPGIDGYEVARRIRARQDCRQPVLIALTGWGQDKDKLQAVQAGFDEHIVKPIDIDQLAKLLKKKKER